MVKRSKLTIIIMIQKMFWNSLNEDLHPLLQQMTSAALHFHEMTILNNNITSFSWYFFCALQQTCNCSLQLQRYYFQPKLILSACQLFICFTNYIYFHYCKADGLSQEKIKSINSEISSTAGSAISSISYANRKCAETEKDWHSPGLGYFYHNLRIDVKKQIQ